MSYTDVFSGSNIYPSDVSYRALSISEDTTVDWPLETDTSSNTLANIMDITATVASLSVTLPDAREASVGRTILVHNTGSYTFDIVDTNATQVVSLAPGILYQIYLTDNSTEQGEWSAFQFGAATSSPNASALAGTGIEAVGTLLSQSIPVSQFNSNYTAGDTDRAKLFVWTGTTGTLTLPSGATVGNNWFIYFKNSGTGVVTLTPSGTDEIDTASTKSIQPQESCVIVSDGTDFQTVGFGQEAAFAFDYTVIDVAGTGDYTLSGTELNRTAYKFTGVLTGNRNIIIPTTVQQYWVDNSTTGAFTLTVKTSAGTGLSVGTGERAIYYCDGSDLVDADSSTASYPITVGNGGTGATTTSAALINLGGSSIGISIFTATDADAVWSLLGNFPLVQAGTF